MLVGLVSGSDVLERVLDGFIEIAAQRIWPNELHRELRRTDERPQIPGELRAEKQVSCSQLNKTRRATVPLPTSDSSRPSN